jgi:hypothetical protein
MTEQNVREYDDHCLQVAAQCWTDKETEHIVMNVELATAFAKRIYKYQTDVDWYDSALQASQEREKLLLQIIEELMGKAKEVLEAESEANTEKRRKYGLKEDEYMIGGNYVKNAAMYSLDRILASTEQKLKEMGK